VNAVFPRTLLRCAVLLLLLGAAVGASATVDSPAPASDDDGDAFGLRFDTDRPVSIRSEELESIRNEGARTLRFTHDVVVVQDDLTMRSQRLEAYYPPKADQPSRMVASGDVRLTNGEFEARCDEVTYERDADRMVCRGNAEYREDDDCIAGQWIEFDLEAETVKVGGGAKVILGRDEPGSGAGGCV